MHGVVSLLDEEHIQRVNDLRDELQERAGIAGAQTSVYPHCSYHVAGHYDPSQIQDALAQLAGETPVFEVATSGLGVFTTPALVLYLAVVRNPQLSHVHERVFRTSNAASSEPLPYYTPERWVPHITLVQGDFDAEGLASAMRFLATRELHWTISVTNLALLVEANGETALQYRAPLTGR